jgi:tetratricopeptide (TPR) repeat protein
MKKYVVFIMMAISIASFGQRKKKGEVPAKTETPAASQSASQPSATGQPQATHPQQPQSAQQAAQQPQASQPQNPMITHFLTKFNVAMRFNDQDAARGALYDLIVANPANDSLFLNLAMMYYENQKYPSTILVCQELLARNAKNTTAIELSAASYEGLNLMDKSLQHYETLYLQTNSYPTLYKMAFLQYDLKRFKECAATSDILLSKKEADELKVSYQIAENKTKEFPIKVAILNLKGMIARENGDKIGAKKLFEQALAIAPDFPQAKENLGKLK